MLAKRVLVEDFEVVPFLASMELDKDTLIAVARFADSQRALCTSNDVRGFDLITTHDKAARGLRERFCGNRWIKDEINNQAGIYNPFLNLRVIPCNFDEYAGNLFADPTNRVIKGEASKTKAHLNRTGWLPGLPIPEPEKSTIQTWVLGIYAEDGKPLGAELSLPLTCIGGHYSQFVKRVVLISGSGESERVVRSRPDRDDAVEVVDIAIKRR